MSEIQTRQVEVERLLAEYFRGRTRRQRPSSTDCPAPEAGESDDRIIELASKAKNGPKFKKLFSGDTSDYPSPSEADLALCLSLAFWTRKNSSWIDRIFRRSGLFREKWDERHHGDGTSYGQATIGRAIDLCEKTYKAGIREMPSDWERDLIWRTDKNGQPLYLERIVANALTIFLNEADWEQVFAFDEFAYRIIIRRPPPYREKDYAIPPDGLAWTDEDEVLTSAWLQNEYRLHVGIDVVHNAAIGAAGKHRFHPVRDYLKGLKWDGTPRLDTWLIIYLGAGDTPYVRAVGSRWLISAVARIFVPGVKADHVLILEGIQGLLKSTALRALAPKWFTDELDAIGSKDAASQLLGVWIVELAELDALSRAEISRVKAFLSKTFDRYRPPYGRNVVKFERQCIFAGTVNHAEYFKDETGNRRFWPVQCFGVNGSGEADIARLERDRDQVWAEAMVRYEAGEKWWLETRGLAELAAREQDDRFQGDVWDPIIEAHIDGRSFVTVGEILLHLSVEIPKQGHLEQNRVVRCLRHLRWTRKQRRHDGKRKWGYVPPSPLDAPSPLFGEEGGDAQTADSTGQSPLSPPSPVDEQRSGEKSQKCHEDNMHRGVYRDAGDGGDGGDSGDARDEVAPCCLSCRGTDFWINSFDEPVCRHCHPPVVGASR